MDTHEECTAKNLICETTNILIFIYIVKIYFDLI